MGLGDEDKAKKKDLTVNKHADDNDQALEYVVEGRRCTKLREDISLWRTSSFVSARLHKNMKFHEGKEKPRTSKMVRFFSKMTQ